MKNKPRSIQNSRSHESRRSDGNQSESQHSTQAMQPLQPGSVAPDFELNATPDQKVDLKHFRGRPVVLVFYPADWSPVCGDQLALYNEILSEFGRFNAQLIGISVDSAWCHNAYAQQRKLHFPLLADFEPKGRTAGNYGVYRKQDGVCERALFVLDRDGIIRWSYVSPLGVNPGADGILNALEEMNQSPAQRQNNQQQLDRPSPPVRPDATGKELAHA